MAEELSKRLDDLRGDIDHRFEDLKSEVREFGAELRELRADMRSQFRWTVTTMVALFGAAVPVWMWVLGLILRVR